MNHCFWCQEKLSKTQRTRDHLISRPLADYLTKKEKWFIQEHREFTVLCCYNCNQIRSKISNLFRLMRNHGSLKRRDEMMPMILDMKEKISILLSGDIREICLLEIKMILEFPNGR